MMSALEHDTERAGRRLPAQLTGSKSRTRRPRIALVQTQAENAGAQEVARLLAAGLAARGYDTAQIFFFRRTAGFDNVPDTHFCAVSRPAGPLRFVQFLYRFFSLLRRLRPDVVLTFQHYGNIIGAPIARAAGVRHVIANQTTTLGALNLAVRKTDSFFGRVGTYDAIVMNSDATDSEHANHPKSYRNRIVHIPHGFERKTSALAKSDARRALALPSDVTLLGGAGRLHPTKNWETIIRLLPRRPQWHLAIAGQGADGARLQALVDMLGCADRVHFLGEILPSRIGTFLACLDVFVFPSLAETFGLAVVEAAQAGVPVVASRLPVLEEVLRVDGESCALFADVADPDAWIAAIDRIFAAPEVAEALGQRGRQLDRVFPLDAMVDQYAAVIERLTAAGRRPGRTAAL